MRMMVVSVMMVSAMMVGAMMMTVVVPPVSRSFCDTSAEQNSERKNSDQVTQPENPRQSQVQCNHYYYIPIDSIATYVASGTPVPISMLDR